MNTHAHMNFFQMRVVPGALLALHSCLDRTADLGVAWELGGCRTCMLSLGCSSSDSGPDVKYQVEAREDMGPAVFESGGIEFGPIK